MYTLPPHYSVEITPHKKVITNTKTKHFMRIVNNTLYYSRFERTFTFGNEARFVELIIEVYETN